jgi:CelD/BcsL family acetyltransferase involved in cellulose biosynthesis
VGAGWGYGGFILSTRKEECLQQIMGAIQKLRGWDIISLGRMVADRDIDVSDVAARMAPKSAVHECTPGAVPYIPLETTWEAYLAERSRSFKRNVRNRSRKLNAIGHVRFQRITRLVESGLKVTTMMMWLRTTAERSWKAGEHTAISSDAGVFAFYGELAERLNAIGCLDVSILWLEERPVAYIFGASYNGEFFEIDIAFDAQLSKASPGIYLRNCLLQELFQQNYRIYDFVAYFDYKKELTSHARRHDVHVFYRRALYPLMLRSLRSVVRSTMPRMMTDYSDLSWGRHADVGA